MKVTFTPSTPVIASSTVVPPPTKPTAEYKEVPGNDGRHLWVIILAAVFATVVVVSVLLFVRKRRKNVQRNLNNSGCFRAPKTRIGG
jgi:hypothetical protein